MDRSGFLYEADEAAATACRWLEAPEAPETPEAREVAEAPEALEAAETAVAGDGG